MAKKRHPSIPQDVDDRASEFFDALKKESDRGCAIVAAAFIEDGLEVLLRAAMSQEAQVVKKTIDPLFKGIGPLSSAWSKAEMCRALRLIPEELYGDLARIRDLRNHFAHSYGSVSFDDAAAKEAVSKFHVFGWSPADSSRRTHETDDAASVRRAFSCAAAYIGGSLIHSARRLHAV